MNNIRLVYIQSGNFREASERFSQGLPETYHAQKYSVGFVNKQAEEFQHVCVICISAKQEYSNFKLSSGVHTYGIDVYAHRKQRWDEIVEILKHLQPTHLVVRGPALPVINWGIANDVRLFVSLADSFYSPLNPLKCVRDKYRHFQLVKGLNHPSVEWVGNHNIAASQQLVEMGVCPTKIIPYDYPRNDIPEDYCEKKLRDTKKYSLLYVGSVKQEKGVGDIISAFSLNENLRNTASLKIAGKGDIDRFKQQVAQSGLAENIEFLGQIPHPEVVKRMRASDVVLVPSWHEYSEGLPGAIYAALAVRTPLVISDHPIFLKYFKGNGDVVISPQKSPEKLADTLLDLLSNDELYSALSHNSIKAFQHISCPVMWADVIRLWLEDSQEAQLKLKKITLNNMPLLQ